MLSFRNNQTNILIFISGKKASTHCIVCTNRTLLIQIHNPTWHEMNNLGYIHTGGEYMARKYNGFEILSKIIEFGNREYLEEIEEEDEIFKHVMILIKEVFDVNWCILRVLNEHTKKLQIVESSGLSEAEFSKIHEVDSKIDIYNRILLVDDVVVINDIKDFQFQNSKLYSEIGINAFIAVTVKIKGKARGTLKIYDKQSREWTKQEVQILKILSDQIGIMLKHVKYFQDINQNFDHMVNSLSLALEYRDLYTKGHLQRVSMLSTILAREMHFNATEISSLKHAAMMHDIGKITISEKILLKTSELTLIEWETIKKHPSMSAEIVKEGGMDENSVRIIKHHHERWDGKGYPDGLKNVEIPIGSRIITVVDAYDAMTSNRPYHLAKNHIEAVKELKLCSGTQFDPRIVEVFTSLQFDDFI